MNSTIQLRLDDPGATWLHNAGVAGLWLTLTELQNQYPLKSHRPGNLDWKLFSDEIYLTWSGQDDKVLDWLLKQAFQTSSDGLLALTGLRPHYMGIEARLAIHKGITSTFLQHNKFVKSDGKAQTIVKLGDREVKVSYKKVTTYAHQTFAKHLCDPQGNLRQDAIGIVSWLYPGLTVRHAAFPTHTKFEETPARSLALVFAPISCWYFSLPAKTDSTRNQYALVVPEVENLAIFAELQQKVGELSYQSFCAVSIGDAGLKYLTRLTSESLRKRDSIHRCYVVLFGEVSWSAQQSTRLDTLKIEVSKEVLDQYQLLFDASLTRAMLFRLGRASLSSLSSIRAILAENLARQNIWWFNLFEQAQKNDLLMDILKCKEVIIAMVEVAPENVESEKLFVKACHEALRKTYAKIYSRTNEGEIPQTDRKNEQIDRKNEQIDRKNEQILSILKRCHNADKFRSFLVEFFSRAGRISILEEHWEELFPITRGTMDWKVSRDLFLLAMASYEKKQPLPSEKADQESALTLTPLEE